MWRARYLCVIWVSACRGHPAGDLRWHPGGGRRRETPIMADAPQSLGAKSLGASRSERVLGITTFASDTYGGEGDGASRYDDDRLREECGVFGILGHPDAGAITALGLHALQHRGQEAAGIVTCDGTAVPLRAAARPRRRQLQPPGRDRAAEGLARGRPRPLLDDRRDRSCATCSRCSPISTPAASRSATTAT